jgi:hypothetical protein
LFDITSQETLLVSGSHALAPSHIHLMRTSDRYGASVPFKYPLGCVIKRREMHNGALSLQHMISFGVNNGEDRLATLSGVKEVMNDQSKEAARGSQNCSALGILGA